MKIKLNKDHFSYKAGQEIEVTAGQAHYFRMMGMVMEDNKPEVEHPVKHAKKHK